jgi:hypothetical protein
MRVALQPLILLVLKAQQHIRSRHLRVEENAAQVWSAPVWRLLSCRQKMMCSSQQLAFLMLQTQQRVETRHDVMRSDPAGFCLSCSGAANKIDVENMSAVFIFMVTSHPQVAQFAHNLTPHLDFVQR